MILFGSLSGCQTIDVRGQMVSDELIAEVNSKKPNKEDLIEMIGTPTYVPDYSQDTWYYIQRSMARRAWFEPKVVKQRIVEVKFAKSGQVVEATLLTDTQNGVKVISNYTKTYGTEQNGLQKFVKNIGKFNKTTDGAKKRNKKK
jgi:outer membrane protein assembly factor BamE (lipoprotein component of BamABCDE complex)